MNPKFAQSVARALANFGFATLAALLSFPAQASGKADLKSGYAAVLRHDHSLAIQYLASAIEAGDLSRANLALAYHCRGAEYLKTGRYDEAILDLDRAIALEPRLPAATPGGPPPSSTSEGGSTSAGCGRAAACAGCLCCVWAASCGGGGP